MSKTFTTKDGKTWTEVTSTSEVTEEILDIVREIESGWYNSTPIDWEDVWERVEGTNLNDGTYLSLGDEYGSPAMKKIQRVIRAERRAG